MKDIKMEDYLAIESFKESIASILKLRGLDKGKEIDEFVLNTIALILIRIENSIDEMASNPEEKVYLLINYIINLWGSLIIEHNIMPDLDEIQ